MKITYFPWIIERFRELMIKRICTKSLYVLTIAVFLVVNSSGVLAKENDINIIVTTNKKVIHWEDKLNIWVEIINNSNKNYSFSSWKLNDIILQKMFYDSNGKLLDRYRKYEFEWPGTIVDYRFLPFKHEIFRLKPLQKKRFEYHFVLKKGLKMVFFPEFIFGTFLENKRGDYIVVNSHKKIIIQVKYKPYINEISNGEYFGFNDMYKGEVVSNKVEIQIK